MKLIFEGSPGAFKSTLAKQLCKEYDLKYIPEILERKSMPSPGTYVSNSIIDQWFFQNEDAKAKLFSIHDQVIQDRSYFSHIAFNYARFQLFGDTVAFEAAESRINSVDNMYDDDCIIFLAKYTDTLHRKYWSEKTIWSNPNFIEQLNSWYFAWAEEKNIPIINTSEGFEYTYSQIKSIIEDKL